ncbi:MAG: cation transporter [Oscillospiraceae bacterium]|nr:cation transporter [Oscillospiraceae bacterium]
MKPDRNIFVAFILNLFFSVFEFVGGTMIGSTAIVSDALHDLGDAMSIGFAFLLEKKSSRKPDDTHTLGYGRYSVLGSLVTTLVLVAGSVAVILNGIHRILNPVQIRYTGMIAFAMIGAAVNLVAALITREGDSLNQKAVNLHMLEDVLGWCVVLVGAVIMKFTDLTVLDPLMSIAVALFVLVHALKNLTRVLDLFLGKTPRGVSVEALRTHLREIEGVLGVGKVQMWSMDGNSCCAAVQVKVLGDNRRIRENIRQELLEHGIGSVTVEVFGEDEPYPEEPELQTNKHHRHHHHHQGPLV